MRTSSISAIIVEEIWPEEKTKILEVGIPIVLLSSVSLEQYEDIQTVLRGVLEQALEIANKELKNFSEFKTQKVKDLLEQYKKERLSEIRSKG
jgi:predicted RNase H-like nuclease (RuvC/YqgF family)